MTPRYFTNGHRFPTFWKFSNDGAFIRFYDETQWSESICTVDSMMEVPAMQEITAEEGESCAPVKPQKLKRGMVPVI